MKKCGLIRIAALAAVAGAGLLAVLPSAASGGDFHIGINLGGQPERHRERDRGPIVYEYDSYCVGYRRNLYDADWRLREAQVDEWRAYDALSATRQREGELAAAVDDHEQLLADFNAHGGGAAAVEEARVRLNAYEKRAASAHADVEASRTLHDPDGVSDAEARARSNEAAAARAARELRDAEEAAGRVPNRERMLEVRDRLPREREDLIAAQNDVYRAQERLDDSVRRCAFALHDRDEAMWLIYRDQIMTGRCEFAVCGFEARASVWGGRMPRDEARVHERLVRPAEYWLVHPAEMQARIAEADDIAELHHIHDIERRHERTYVEIERVELTVPMERRRAYAEGAVAERERIAASKAEREAAAREHRPVRITAAERAEARATVTRARGEANAERTEARGQARAEDIKARSDARAETTKARADARSEQIKANADSRSEVTKARADARSEEIESRADAKTERTEARADAKTKEQAAREAKLREQQARQDAAKAQREAQKSRDNKSDSSRNTKDKSSQDQASTDPNAH